MSLEIRESHVCYFSGIWARTKYFVLLSADSSLKRIIIVFIADI